MSKFVRLDPLCAMEPIQRPSVKWLLPRTVVMAVKNVNHLAVTPHSLAAHGHCGHPPLTLATCFRRDPPFRESILERSAVRRL